MRFLIFVAISSIGTFAASVSLPKLEGKIVGGNLAAIEDFPYQVSVQYFTIHLCGGTIISKNKILTAAHCTEKEKALFLRVRAGTSKYNSGGQFVKVLRIEQDARFNSTTYNYDFSILHLAEDLVFNEAVQPIEVTRFEPSPSEVAVVSGWGNLAEVGDAYVKLMSVEVPVLDRNVCNVYYKGLVTDMMICAGFLEGGKDACQGDSGGPIVGNGKLIGIVSWGYGCARPKYPGIYTNVAKFDIEL